MRNVQIGSTYAYFDGVDDYISISTGVSSIDRLNLILDFFVESINYSDAYNGLIALDSATYLMIRPSDETLFISLRLNGSQRTFTTGFKIEANNLYKVQVVYDGTELKVYNYDELVYTSSASGSVAVRDSFANIGSYNNSWFFNGRMYYLKVNDLAEYKFEGSAEDLTGNGNDGVPYGATFKKPELDSILVLNNGRLRRVIGKVMTANGLKDFYRPIDFKTDFATTTGMIRQPIEENGAIIKDGKLFFDTLISYNVYEGRNLFVMKTARTNTALTWASGAYFNETNSLASDYISVRHGEWYTCSHTINQLMFYDINKTFIGAYRDGEIVPPGSTGNNAKTFKVDDSRVAFVRIAFRNNFLSGTTVEERKVKFEAGILNTPYTPAPEDEEE